MKIVVTGGRHYGDEAKVTRVLDAIHGRVPITGLAHGGYSGADTLAGRWAKARKIPVTVFYAQWNELGKRAGPVRNRLMLDEFAPQRVVAFPGGDGTADCCAAAQERSIKIIHAEKVLATTGG